MQKRFFKKLLFPYSNISLYAIYVQYDRNECGGSDQVFTQLKTYLKPLEKDAKITFLRVDNRNETKVLTKTSYNSYEVGGDNTYREFSGWQKGIDVLREMGGDFDLILFVNDMFLKPGASFLKHYATKELLKTSLSQNAIIGRLDSTGEQYKVYDFNISQWICTNCFLVPKTAIDDIGDIVSVKENLDDFLPPEFPETDQLHANKTAQDCRYFHPSAPINEAYKKWLVEWLTQHWHSKFEITPNTWGLFRTKVRNILNESLLSARIIAAGFKVMEYGKKLY